MPDLIAQGSATGQRWRRALPTEMSGDVITIGRSEGDWNVQWDPLISRQHVKLVVIEDGRVDVQVISNARNPVFHGGRQAKRFTLVPGEHFVIGRTTFTLAHRPGTSDSPVSSDMTEHAYDHIALRRRHFRDANSRIDMLSRLPDLITGSTTDQELLVRVTGVLLQATPLASAVAIVQVDDSHVQADTPNEQEAQERKVKDKETGDCEAQDREVRVLHYDSRSSDLEGPAISNRLVRSVVDSRESRLHCWAGSRRDAMAYTASENVDWAFCVPLRSEACPGWAMYVTGQSSMEPGANLGHSMQAAPDDREDDVKFAELVGAMVGNLRQSIRLERRQAAMRRFFAPVVMDALAKRDVTEVLTPRECELSVLFCDLRGFSRQSEQSADRLLELLARVSDALGVMTKHILETRGVIGDFHGDAAMGFWGWPLEQSDQEQRAAMAAIRIWHQYVSNVDQTGFRCGIGIASGLAVAGRIGTTDQVKVTAFGPVVNLASRLEGISKIFGAEIILDEVTANRLQAPPPVVGDSSPTLERDSSAPRLADSMPSFRIRRLAKVRPAGLSEPLEISQLLGTAPSEQDVTSTGNATAPPPGQQSLTEQDIQHYEMALDSFIAGDWDEAYRLLHALPPWDRPKDVLLSTILQYNRIPPPSWDGVIDLPK